jgi:MFS transporter, putative metabolite:H+ symporter
MSAQPYRLCSIQEACLDTNEYIFQQEDPKNFSSEFNLICRRDYLNNLILIMHSVGEITGNLFFGQIADAVGRKWPLVLGNAFIVCVFFALLFSPAVQIVCLSTCVLGIFYGSMGPLIICYLLETARREWIAFYCGYLFFGYTFVKIPFYAVVQLQLDWRTLIIMNMVGTSSLFLLFWFLKESPRFYAARAKYKKAKEVIYSIAKFNKKDIGEITLQGESIERIYHTNTWKEWKDNKIQIRRLITIFDLLVAKPTRVDFFIILLFSLLNSFQYSMITQQSETTPELVYFDTGINCIGCLLAIVIAKFLKRRWIIFGFGIMNGCLSVIYFITGQSRVPFILILLFHPTLCLTITLATYELFPTICKTISMGASRSMFLTGSILCLAADMVDITWSLLAGISTIILSFLAYWLTESRDLEIVDQFVSRRMNRFSIGVSKSISEIEDPLYFPY